MFQTDEFSFSVELWSPRKSAIEKTLCLSSNLIVARGAFEAARTQYPDRELTLRHGCRVIASQRPGDRPAEAKQIG